MAFHGKAGRSQWFFYFSIGQAFLFPSSRRNPQATQKDIRVSRRSYDGAFLAALSAAFGEL
jgi:hypothetical protein